LGKKSQQKQRPKLTPSPWISAVRSSTLGRGAELLKLVIAVETWNYPPPHRLPRRLENGLIHGTFETEEALERYQRELAESQAPEIELYDDGYPKLPACLDRRR
jgi:hypothetical protein